MNPSCKRPVKDSIHRRTESGTSQAANMARNVGAEIDAGLQFEEGADARSSGKCELNVFLAPRFFL